MKKYTIKDKSGTKKTVYAKDLAHALTFADNKVKDEVVSNYFYFDLDDLGMSLDNAVNIMKNCGLTIVKIDKRSKEAKVYYRGTFAAEQKAADKLDISLDDSIKDSIKDEANLPTTIQALVNDEEAAIKAYEVAIKNLEGKIDETQMQVLINIMKDERRHVENLYAILNGQVTEKNLEDSKMKDAAPGVDEKTFNRLVSYFDVWGKPSKRELQDVIDYYRLNSATAYQLLIYWGYKDEFKKLHFYDSIHDATLEITVKNQSEYREIDSIAKKLHLGFYETTGNKAILEGSRKDLEEYIDLVFGGDASIKRQIRG